MVKSRAMSAVFSNLAKAAEKQHSFDASSLFGTLAEHYRESVEGDGDIEALRALIAEDVDTEYPAVNDAAVAAGDRGTLRAAKWAEKVTKLQRGLVDRYASKGEALLESQELFLCEACGFIYLGNEAPDICPVCKAPQSRFSLVK